MLNNLFDVLGQALPWSDSFQDSGFWVVFLAGLSQAIAQSIILFVNQVRPLRFLISLVLAALLFVVGYGTWAFSIWLASAWLLDAPIALDIITRSLTLGYLPLTLSFLGALPYLGLPILRLLAVWSLLLVVASFEALANLSAPLVVAHVGLGWVVLLVLQQTVGQPLVRFGHWLTNKVAGVQLVVDQNQLRMLINQRAMTEGWGTSEGAAPSPENPSKPDLSANLASNSPKSLDFADSLDSVESLDSRADSVFPNPAPRATVRTRATTSRQQWLAKAALNPRVVWLRRWLRLFVIYGGLALLTLVISLALEPVRDILLRVLNRLSFTRLPTGPLFEVLWIGGLALVVAGLLAPLEALGWWAGWYGDPVQTLPPLDDGNPVNPEAPAIRRYIVYLDGINQATADYQPAVAQYLTELGQCLPADMALVKGLMPYSVLNRSLTQGRPLAFFWRSTKALSKRFAGWVGMVINLRNLMIVAVSADSRYGPIYNQGVAQRVYESLVQQGYPLGGGVPLTLIGYSGGGQIAMGIMPFLRRALFAPIEVISLGGVISGNVRALEAEQLYHLVGDRDKVERLGPIMFPRRWPLMRLSYWNRAKRQGNITFISLGPVAHQVPGGVVDPNAFLPDGRSHLQQTVDLTLDILVGDLRQQLDLQKDDILTQGNYYRYQTTEFNHPSFYPPGLVPPAPWYRPVAPWMGRLILPKLENRHPQGDVGLEVLHAPPDYADWIGQVVQLHWRPDPDFRREFQIVSRDIHFSADAEASHRDGLILPTRLNHWRVVSPLESLAGARPVDDVVVQLPDPVTVEWVRPSPLAALPVGEGDKRLLQTQGLAQTQDLVRKPLRLTVVQEPIQTSGRFYGLVRFVEAVDEGPERFRVAHFNPATGQFDGLIETVWLPTVVLDSNDTPASVNQDLDKSPLNQDGWYIYGACAASGEFVVQSLRPRRLFQLRPGRFLGNHRQGRHYLERESWQNLAAKKGTVESVLIDPRWAEAEEAAAQWQEGDQALLVHVYGGIGGAKAEPATQGPVYFGHFSYGMARVVREPIANELQFQIRYHQVYAHSRRGLIAGTLDWTLYMGDRQWGFMGTRPVSDILVKLPAYTEPFSFVGSAWSALDDLCLELEIMTARYRIGDGNGVTYIGPANNCAQDSNQALYASAKYLEDAILEHRAKLKAWEARYPHQAKQLRQLIHFRKAIQRRILPFGSARADWETAQETLGSNLSDYPLKNLGRGLLSWRTMLPRKASDTITELCLDHGAALWVLRTNQIGGENPDIEPVAPFTL
ncbi:CAAX protease [Phormidium sp. FACHB-1136]|uniref:CAAX protease n=1 Tax=Phormidium sp. FACHB-1136 TaxID=2692848 RepID=UPI001688718C|nr:CAAX protease [Phormidium sp. FACHB-1136]MBD2427162.1 CAAX protease [Phormidium sp. FACHB-1136]